MGSVLRAGYSHLSAEEGGVGTVAGPVLATRVATRTTDVMMQGVLEW